MKITFFLVAFLVMSNCYSEDSFEKAVRSRFVVELEPLCKKVKAAEPRMPSTPFFSRRYYLSIDGEQNCQILDVWIQRITNSSTDNRREIYSVLYRFSGGLWLKEFGLDDKPLLRIKDKKTGVTYFFTELNEDLFYRSGVVYFSGDWEDDDRAGINAGLQPLDFCQNMPVFECKFVRVALERIIWLELGKKAFQ